MLWEDGEKLETKAHCLLAHQKLGIVDDGILTLQQNAGGELRAH